MAGAKTGKWSRSSRNWPLYRTYIYRAAYLTEVSPYRTYIELCISQRYHHIFPTVPRRRTSQGCWLSYTRPSGEGVWNVIERVCLYFTVPLFISHSKINQCFVFIFMCVLLNYDKNLWDTALPIFSETQRLLITTTKYLNCSILLGETYEKCN